MHIDPPELAGKRPVCLTWVPGHTGIPGNERADQPARQASFEAFVGPEPALMMMMMMNECALTWRES